MAARAKATAPPPPDRRAPPIDRRSDSGIDERTLPHSLEAEKAVLGAILVHNDAHLVALRYLTPHAFFRDAHRRIFAAMSRLLAVHQGGVDLVTLKNELLRVGDLEECGGPVYIANLIDGIARSSNVAHYARIVQDHALLRELIVVSNTTLTDAYAAEESAGSILNQLDAKVVGLQHGAQSSRMTSTAAAADRLLTELEYRVAHQGELSGVTSGFTSVDSLTYGWQAGDMIVLAARPSMGKTALVLNMAANAAQVARRSGDAAHVGIFSLEMRTRQLENRLLATMSGVPLTSIQTGYLFDAHWPPLSQAIGTLSGLHIHIDDAAARTVQDIRAECRRLRAEHGLDLVIVDYIQLMSADLQRRGASRNDEVTFISRSLKTLADDISAPIIVISQLKRTQGKEPDLEDLRESGSLEQDADIVAFIHRKDHRVGGPTRLILAKQRNGPTGSSMLHFDRDRQSFTDLGEAPEPEPEAAPAPKSAEEKQAEKVKAIIRAQARKRT